MSIKEGNSKVGFTASSFDLLHAGHVLMLKECKEYCDKLVVGFNRFPAGKDFVQSPEERLIQLEAIKYVDEIHQYNTEAELLEIMKKVQPDVRFLGDDYKERNDYTGAELNIPIVYNNRDHGYSTSELKERTAKKSQLFKNNM
jgi:glycerol-3-phosphate cytidylyltransferase